VSLGVTAVLLIGGVVVSMVVTAREKRTAANGHTAAETP
jgi:hypothetical protein